ncbi:hypothetical protein [Nocardia sp. No.11]|uniref:hypothetical protein n=1 Tax=Nocardia sp. No.11 TaxID=3128861 RepID=UPI00319E28A0
MEPDMRARGNAAPAPPTYTWTSTSTEKTLTEHYTDLRDLLGQRLSPLGRSGGELGLSILDNGCLIGDWTADIYLFGRTFTERMDLIIRRYQTPEWLMKY